MRPAPLLCLIPLGIWIYLVAGRGGFWRAIQRDDNSEPAVEPARWPSVVAIVPARNEADVIVRSIGSVLAQDYPGCFRAIVVDDRSEDGTLETARALGSDTRLTVIAGGARPAGWTGKLWAVAQGVEQAKRDAPYYLWLTDADIAHAPDNLRRLIARAEEKGLVLTSLMAKLSSVTAAERFFIPSFVYFFQMLYPFAWVNDPKNHTAAAAGGCMLVRRSALEGAGGIAGIRDAIIDDCALAKRMKTQGPIWLGLTERAVSIRPYENIGAIRRMVVRSAYAQLEYSPALLAVTIAGLGLIFIAPPLLTLLGRMPIRIAGVSAWALMAASAIPMLRFYRRSPLWGLALPAIGAVYAAFTLDSGLQHWRGRGGMWKGRAQAPAQR